MTVTLERSAARMWPSSRPSRAEPAAGYTCGEITVEPKTVTVVGPESRLKEPISVVTERIMIDGRTSTVIARSASASSIRRCGSRAPQVRVLVDIEAERAAR